MHKNIGYDPLKAFVPVGLIMETPQIVTVHPNLPVKTMAELVAYAKANPGKISFGSQGFGVGPHLMIELLKLDAGIKCPRSLSRHGADADGAPGRRGAGCHRSDHHHPGAYPVGQDPRNRDRGGRARTKACRTCRPPRKRAFRSCRRRSGSASWRRPARRTRSSQSSTPRFANAGRSSGSQRLAKLGAEAKIGTPEEFGKLISQTELALWSHVVSTAGIKVE